MMADRRPLALVAQILVAALVAGRQAQLRPAKRRRPLALVAALVDGRPLALPWLLVAALVAGCCLAALVATSFAHRLPCLVKCEV
jgi:hypothetical protein